MTWWIITTVLFICFSTLHIVGSFYLNFLRSSLSLPLSYHLAFQKEKRTKVTWIVSPTSTWMVVWFQTRSFNWGRRRQDFVCNLAPLMPPTWRNRAFSGVAGIGGVPFPWWKRLVNPEMFEPLGIFFGILRKEPLEIGMNDVTWDRYDMIYVYRYYHRYECIHMLIDYRRVVGIATAPGLRLASWYWPYLYLTWKLVSSLGHVERSDHLWYLKCLQTEKMNEDKLLEASSYPHHRLENYIKIYTTMSWVAWKTLHWKKWLL